MNPWDRRDNETDPAWQAFQTYRDLGLERSTAEVARQLGKSKTLMDRWSATHSWVHRAGAWDIHLDQQRQESTEDAVREMAERHAKIAIAGLDVVAQGLEDIDPSLLTVQDLARFAQVFALIEREARGFGQVSKFAVVAAEAEEALVDMGNEEDREKVIALAEWVGRKVD